MSGDNGLRCAGAPKSACTRRCTPAQTTTRSPDGRAKRAVRAAINRAAYRIACAHREKIAAWLEDAAETEMGSGDGNAADVQALVRQIDETTAEDFEFFLSSVRPAPFVGDEERRLRARVAELEAAAAAAAE